MNININCNIIALYTDEDDLGMLGCSWKQQQQIADSYTWNRCGTYPSD